MFCSQILFSSATVAFRTNFLSLADFKSDLSWTNLKLSSSATWPKDTKAYMCYGCDYPLRPKPTGQPSAVLPPARFDVILCRKEPRMYKTRAGALTFSVQPQNVYYHLKKTCVLNKNKHFATEDLCVKLAD